MNIGNIKTTTLLLVGATCLASCNSDDKNDGLDKIVNAQNATAGTYHTTGFILMYTNHTGNKRHLYSYCRDNAPVTRDQLAENVEEIYDDGACFNRSTRCTYVQDGNLLYFGGAAEGTTIMHETVGHSVTAIAYNQQPLIYFDVEVSTPTDENCQNDSKLTIPVLNGKYIGYAYRIVQIDQSTPRAAISRSEAIVLNCVDGICAPEENQAIDSSLDFRAKHSDGGDYLLSDLVKPDDANSYQFSAVTSSNGTIISGVSYPVTANNEPLNCSYETCITYTFEKVNN